MSSSGLPEWSDLQNSFDVSDLATIEENTKESLYKANEVYKELFDYLREKIREAEEPLETTPGPEKVSINILGTPFKGWICLVGWSIGITSQVYGIDYSTKHDIEISLKLAGQEFENFSFQEVEDKLDKILSYIQSEDDLLTRDAAYVDEREALWFNCLPRNVVGAFSDKQFSFIKPALQYLGRFENYSEEDLVSSINHELTHAYIDQRTSFSAIERYPYLNEGAAQAVDWILGQRETDSDLYGETGDVGSAEYLKKAEKYFLERVVNQEPRREKAIDGIRRKAVKVIKRLEKENISEQEFLDRKV